MWVTCDLWHMGKWGNGGRWGGSRGMSRQFVKHIIPSLQGKNSVFCGWKISWWAFPHPGLESEGLDTLEPPRDLPLGNTKAKGTEEKRIWLCALASAQRSTRPWVGIGGPGAQRISASQLELWLLSKIGITRARVCYSFRGWLDDSADPSSQMSPWWTMLTKGRPMSSAGKFPNLSPFSGWQKGCAVCLSQCWDSGFNGSPLSFLLLQFKWASISTLQLTLHLFDNFTLEFIIFRPSQPIQSSLGGILLLYSYCCLPHVKFPMSQSTSGPLYPWPAMLRSNQPWIKNNREQSHTSRHTCMLCLSIFLRPVLIEFAFHSL